MGGRRAALALQVGEMKASDVPEGQIIEAIEQRKFRDLGANVWTEIMPRLPEFPEKVVLAKVRSMMKRGIIKGCPCGCRGDWLPGSNWPR